ncbi:hypothetical protein FLAVO9R_40397 [Flavobacterium sp. 9R]|nr:hypothetical protein FLAVO9R_40397 [Flavobacterium sp. 9R]
MLFFDYANLQILIAITIAKFKAKCNLNGNYKIKLHKIKGLELFQTTNKTKAFVAVTKLKLPLKIVYAIENFPLLCIQISLNEFLSIL